MQAQNKNFNSIIPILILSLGAFVVMQLFMPKNKTPVKEQKNDTVITNKSDNLQMASGNNELSDFTFSQIKTSIQKTKIRTSNFIISLSSQGARIEKFYLRKTATLPLPESAIIEQDKEVAEKYDALEITRDNGMDFQPHLYYSSYAHESTEEQLASPFLNRAHFNFQKKSIYTQTNEGSENTIDKNIPMVQEIVYQSPVMFKKKKLLLTKLYRFYEKENYFRQITILQNVDNTDFGLFYQIGTQRNLGDLYYKPFSDLGPWYGTKQSKTTMNYLRFFDYRDKLQVRRNDYQGSSSSCNFLMACSGIDQEGSYSRFYDSPDTLQFAGTGSRYFMAYTELLSPEHVYLPKADGILYKNATRPSGKESFTLVFLKFFLAQKKANSSSLIQNISLHQKNYNDIKELIADEATSTRNIRKLQKEHKDMLVLDQKVYVGSYATKNHRYQNKDLMEAAFGSKKENEKALKVVQSGLTGFFYKISEFIISIMQNLYAVTGNYGWSIILIVMIFKLIIFPINHMQAENMKKMSDLKPQIEQITKKYADAKERQKHLIEFYKVNKVNPAKGCLPILIQMPIFIALYSAFANSLELWRSPFILWMQDLSQPDTIWIIPYLNLRLNVLPLLMVVTQILQQYFTMNISDPQQKMIMFLMPCIMLFFFWQIPSGVTLYWTAQNIFSLIGRLMKFAYTKITKDPKWAAYIPRRKT